MPADRIATESRMREIRLSGSMRGREVTVKGADTYHPVLTLPTLL